MKQERMKPWITGKHLPGRPGCGIALKNAGDVFTQTVKHWKNS
jgi:hypothetical protein